MCEEDAAGCLQKQLRIEMQPPEKYEFIYWSSVECRGLNVEGEGKKSRARVKSRG
jgi:hypothetical protein